jgi:hypothetical protein
LQEELENKCIAVSFKATKLTSRVFAKALAATLRQMKKAHNKPRIGQQSIKRLNRTVGGATDTVEVGERIESFEKYARKNRVSYHVEKNTGTHPPRWTVYFKAEQAGGLTAAFEKYTRDILSVKSEKPSVRETMRKFRELVKHAVIDRTRHKERGGQER